MAGEERKPRSTRSQKTTDQKQANDTDETHNLAKKPSTDTKDITKSATTEAPADEEKREHKLSSFPDPEDTYTFQQWW